MLLTQPLPLAGERSMNAGLFIFVLLSPAGGEAG